jgi:hypothetical protein
LPLGARAVLPDFSWNNSPKREKFTKMNMNYTKGPQIMPIGRKIDQMLIKYTNNFHCKTLQNLPKGGFLVSKYLNIWQP